MDWSGVAAGAVAGLVLQNVAYPSLQLRYARWRKRRQFRNAEIAGRMMEKRFGSIVLVQAGWGNEGIFAHDAILLELGRDFEIQNPDIQELMENRSHEWKSDGYENGRQVGISSLRISRVSDRPEDDRTGRSHRVIGRMHSYEYFEFLSTHRLLLEGSEDEKRTLFAIAGEPNCRSSIEGFPNPFSVGLSAFCEDGDYLALTRRTVSLAAGGGWHGGKIYNAVGENAAPRDFNPGIDGVLRSSPYLIAHRGLWEELGLPAVAIDACEISLHSLAYATDLRDHKVFGHVNIPLSRGELQDAWRQAPDRSESAGSGLDFHSVRTRSDAQRLLHKIADEAEEWAPEAVFCTVRSMLVRNLVTPSAVSRILGR
jgi:hypothetical protein